MNKEPVAAHLAHLEHPQSGNAPLSPSGGSLLTLGEWPAQRIRHVLELSQDLARQRRSQTRSDARTTGPLAGKVLAAIFEKPSTRTRAAFCVASYEEGALPQCLGPDEIHLGAKEAVCDTARVLSRFFSVIAWRGHDHAVVEELARYADVPVINLLSDRHHPTQALADGMTMIEEFGTIAGRKLTFLGDVTNNVARSLCELAEALEFTVTLSGPEHLLESPLTPRGNAIIFDPDPMRAVKGADVVYTDVWTSMGFAGPGSSGADTEAALEPYQVNARLMDGTQKTSTIFMHCLPANRGREVTSEVMDSSQSRILVQAENRLHTIKAILLAAFGR